MPKRPAPIIPAFNLPADATVAEMLGDVERRQEEMRLSPEERRKLAEMRQKEQAKRERAKQKAEQQAPNRIFLLMPVELKANLERIAAQEGVPVSQLCTFFLYESLRGFEAGTFQIGAYKQPSYSPRYDAELIHPSDTERRQRRNAQKDKKGWG